ncbi:hypothetical protein ABFX02_14G184950 [Erythranthe guttata]
MARITVSALVLRLLLLMHAPNFAAAASGGRMGGSFFSSDESPPPPPSISSDSVRRNYSPPSKTDYSIPPPNYNYYPSAPPEPYDSVPPVYAPPRKTYYSAPPPKTYNSAPPPKTDNSAPPAKTHYSSVHQTYNYYPPEPYFSDCYDSEPYFSTRRNYAPAAKTYNSACRNNARPADNDGSSDHNKTFNSSSGGDNIKSDAEVLVIFTILLASVIVFVLICVHAKSIGLQLAELATRVKHHLWPPHKTTVLKLQVGLLDLGKSVQRELDGIAETADASTLKGLHYILTETMVALLRHADCCVFTYSSADVKRSKLEGENRFNQLSIEERSKFDKETLVNVNNIRKNQSSKTGIEEEGRRIFHAETRVYVDSIQKQSKKSNRFSNEYIVITILAAVRGAYKIPRIKNNKDLKEALTKLASMPLTSIMAVEVLWTPQEEDETLSELELRQDYPLLRPLKDGISFAEMHKFVRKIQKKMSFNSKQNKD